MIATVVIIIFFVFLVITSLLYLLGWRYNPDSDIPGGVILMWIILLIFLLIIIFAARSRQSSIQIPTQTAYINP